MAERICAEGFYPTVESSGWIERWIGMTNDVIPVPAQARVYRGVVREGRPSPRARGLQVDLWLTRRVRRLAVRLLREAAQILGLESYPFPMLEAARRLRIEDDDVVRATRLAREAIGEDRDEHQLIAAADLLEGGWWPQRTSRRRRR